jgi:RNA polymerase sigma-70 factor (ECF subfamily)
VANSDGTGIPEEHAVELADFYKANARWLFGHAYLRARRDPELPAVRETAADLVQEAFVAAACDWGTVRGLTVEQQRGWLRRTLAHKETDAFRRRRRLRNLLPQLMDRYQPADADPERQALCVAALEKAVETILRLPARQRDIALMKWNDHMTESEIAAELGCTKGAVGAQVHEIRRKLMEGLGRYYPFNKDGGTGEAS